MAIAELDEENFVRVLQQHLRPSSPIDSYELLYGRERQLEQVKQAMYSPGRQVFIYGDRGVGKTSLAKTAAFKHNPATGEPVFVACGSGTTFSSLVSEILAQLRTRAGIAETKLVSKASFGLKGFGIERTVEQKKHEEPTIHDFNSATESLKTLASNWSSRVVVVIDEFDQLKDSADQVQFAELIKQLGDKSVNVAIIFCGIGRSLDDLLTAHGSSYRYLEGIELPRLSEEATD